MNKILGQFKKIQYNSPAILTFTALSFFTLLLSYAIPADGGGTLNWTTFRLFSVYRSSMADPFFYIRIVGHVLGHVNAEHFFNNFIIILLVGPMLEEKYGTKKIVYMILFTAVITGVINMILFPNSILIGASGVVFMMILLSSFVNIQKGRIPLTLIVCVIVFLGREMVSGVIVADNISQITHIIGGICGAFFGFFINKDKFSADKTVSL